MDGSTRSEIDVLKDEIRTLKEQNNQIVGLLLQRDDGIRQNAASYQSQQMFGIGNASLLSHSTTNEGDRSSDVNAAEHMAAGEHMLQQSKQG